jgi:hypothetical protein
MAVYLLFRENLLIFEKKLFSLKYYEYRLLNNSNGPTLTENFIAIEQAVGKL